MIASEMASVAQVAPRPVIPAEIMTTVAHVATVLATAKSLNVFANSHSRHKSHGARTDYGNRLFAGARQIERRVARHLSSSLVVRMERVASRQVFQRLGRSHRNFLSGQSGKRRVLSARTRAPPP